MPEFEPNSSSDRTRRKRNMLLYKEEQMHPTNRVYNKHSPIYQFRFQLNQGKTQLYSTCTNLKECTIVPYASGTLEYIIMVLDTITVQDIINHIPLLNNNNSFVYTVQILDYYPSYTVKVSYKFINKESSSDGFSFYNSQIPETSVYSWYNANCSSVTIVSFGDIPLSRAGHQFYSLENLSISNSSKPIILPYTTGYNMFYQCAQFSPIQLQWDMSYLTSMERMFYGCSEFNPVSIQWNLSSVVSLNETFMNCTSFSPESFVISNSNNVVTSKRTFKGCTSFTTNIRAWNLQNSTDFSEMFYDCTAFEVDLSSWPVSPSAVHTSFNINSAVGLPSVWV